MSRGALEYAYSRINDVIDRIKDEIVKTESEIQSGELNYYKPYDYYKKNYPDRTEFKSKKALARAVLNKYNESLECLERAAIYAQRIEWLLSSDDGYESFILRTEEQLKMLEDSKKKE